MLNRMNIVVSVLSLLGVALSATAASESTAPRTLRLSSDVWPPFTDVPGKSRVAIDLVENALERSGVEGNTAVREDFADLMGDLRSGKIDGAVAVWHTEERERFLNYSRPYLENRLVLVGRKGSDLSAVSLSLLSGKRIGVVGGYAYGAAVEKVSGPVFVEGPSDGENLQRLVRAEVDYVLADELVVQHLYDRFEDKAKRLLAVGAVPLVERTLHFAVRRDLPGAAGIIQRFDAEIRAMVADGSYNRILQVDWIRADVDGDGVVELVLGGSAAGELPPSSSYEVFDIDKPKVPAGKKLVDLRYIIKGQAYDSWADVPSEYKVTTKQDPNPDRSGLVLFEF